jgi:hypothetical protein
MKADRRSFSPGRGISPAKETSPTRPIAEPVVAAAATAAAWSIAIAMQDGGAGGRAMTSGPHLTNSLLRRA